MRIVAMKGYSLMVKLALMSLLAGGTFWWLIRHLFPRFAQDFIHILMTVQVVFIGYFLVMWFNGKSRRTGDDTRVLRFIYQALICVGLIFLLREIPALD